MKSFRRTKQRRQPVGRRRKSTLIWISVEGIVKNKQTNKKSFCLQNKAHRHETTRTRTGRLVMHVKALSPLVSLIWQPFPNRHRNRGGFTEHLMHHSVQFEEGTTNTT